MRCRLLLLTAMRTRLDSHVREYIDPEELNDLWRVIDEPADEPVSESDEDL